MTGCSSLTALTRIRITIISIPIFRLPASYRGVGTPLRELENTVDFFVAAPDPGDDRQAIYETILAARTYQETSPGPVEIHLEPIGTEYMANPDDGAIFLLRRYEKDGTVYRPNNLVINGHGATILINDPTRSLAIENGLNIIIKVDESNLPVPGTMIAVDLNRGNILKSAPVSPDEFPDQTGASVGARSQPGLGHLAPVGIC